jgi:hypothetical protein
MMNRTELLRLRREYEWHMEHHPSERWAAKLETINLVLSWHEDAGGAPAQGAAEASRETFSNFPTTARREGPTSHTQPRREGAPAGGA